MNLLRIINKESKLFLRDDFEFDETIEIGLDVQPAQGLYQPKWTGSEWIEGLTQEEIDAIKGNATREPSSEERLKALEQLELERMLGGV